MFKLGLEVILVLPNYIIFFKHPQKGGGFSYWAMDDGSKSNNGFHAPRSQSFTKPEVELLVRTFKINFNLYCTTPAIAGVRVFRKKQLCCLF